MIKAQPLISAFRFEARQELFKDGGDGFIDSLAVSVHHDFRVFGRFVWGVDSGEVADLAGARFFVEVFRVARFAHLQWRIDEDDTVK